MLNINVFRPVVHEKKIFKDLPKFPLFFCPLNGPLIDVNLNPHQPRLFPITYGWNWPGGSWEEFV